MNIRTKAIVSNSEMAKNYKGCREKAENSGKIFVFKNNQPDAVLFSVADYEKISEVLEYLENMEILDIAALFETLKMRESGGF